MYSRKKRWCFTADGPTSRQTVPTKAKSLFKTKPVTTTTTTTTVAWQAKKINKQINKLETRGAGEELLDLVIFLKQKGKKEKKKETLK